jgi:hypothetical protein
VSPARRAKLARLAEDTAANPPVDLAARVRDELGVDLTARYGGRTIPHPFGKASGQLSSTVTQVQADVAQGIAFVVLKTVIAEDAAGSRSMGEWTIQESRMQVERLRSATGRDGWTVTWKGRGWPGPLSAYLRVLEDALGAARERDVPVIPSVKYHLPAAGEPFLLAEYEHTTRALLEVWVRGGSGGAMHLEKDFSPTLAGDRRAVDRDSVLEWVASVPGLIDSAAPGKVRVGMKLMNTLFDDSFQLDMLCAAMTAQPAPAFLVVFNRLFDPDRGVAYGGWDLSDRNLRVLDLMPSCRPAVMPSLCATGNICSGRMMIEYGLRGCESGQIHTFFQVPLAEYTATGGGRTARALHTLMLHPTDGLVPWLWHLAETGALAERNGMIHFLDCVPGAAR